MYHGNAFAQSDHRHVADPGQRQCLVEVRVVLEEVQHQTSHHLREGIDALLLVKVDEVGIRLVQLAHVLVERVVEVENFHWTWQIW